MKLHRGVVIFIAIVVFLGMAAGVYADLAEDVFQYLHFSGFLAKKQTTPEGKTISIPIEGDQNINITFKIYNSESGGEELWGEFRENITFDEGFFDVILGKVEPINLPFDEPYWLGVTISGDLVEMERVKIGPSGYSYMALDSQNADTVDGVHAADLEESAETDGKIATHKEDPNAHHTKTSSFSELTDMATDEQVPNNITIMYAATAGDADTVNGVKAAELEESAEIESKIATHKADTNAHHIKTTKFSELTDMATDAQIPDDITIEHAKSADRAGLADRAKDADTLDGKKAEDFAVATDVGDGHSLDAADGSPKNVVYVSNSGRVGIGTTSPSEKLDVIGNIKVNKIKYSIPYTHFFVVGSEGFVPSFSGIGSWNCSAIGAYIYSGSGSMVAPVHLPQGANITHFKVYFYDNSTSDIVVTLNQVSLTGGGYDQIAQVDSSGILKFDDKDTPSKQITVNNLKYSYRISAYCKEWDFDLAIKGAVVIYTTDWAL